MPGGGNGRSGTAVFRENFVAICTHDRRLWIWIYGYPWIYPWISTENLWIWIWIWMANFISTASLPILDYKKFRSDFTALEIIFVMCCKFTIYLLIVTYFKTL